MILIGMIASLSLSAFAKEPKTIQIGNVQVEKINKKIVYQLDKENKRGINDILSSKTREWKQPDSENLVFELAKSTIWFQVKLENNSQKTKNYFLELHPVFLEEVYVYDSNARLTDATGSSISQNSIQAFQTLRLEVLPGINTFYVKVKSRANALSTILRSDSENTKKARFDLAVFCLLLGGLLTLFVYHIFLFFTYRHSNYLFYSFFIAATTIFTISFTSYHKYILPNQIFSFEIGFWWSALSAPLLFITMYLFSIDILGIKPSWNAIKQGRANQLLLLLPTMEVACILAIFLLDDPRILIPIRILALLHILILPTIAFLNWRKNRMNKIALYYAFSWLPFAVGATLIVAWLSGVIDHADILSWSAPLGALMQSVLLSFAAGQRMNNLTNEKIEEQLGKLRVMDELKIHVKNLVNRDNVISSFVSNDVVAELDRGEDPLLYSPRNVEKCIVFIDMHGYTSFSETHSARELHKVINEYFAVINDTTYASGGTVDKIIGDAMMIVFEDANECLNAIINIRKNISGMNRTRVANGLQPLKFGLGVTYGPMLSANFGSSHKIDRTLVGDTVNVAARLETITRNFSVDILCSKEFADLLVNCECIRPAGYVLLKGRIKKSLVYEIFEHNSVAVREWKKSTTPTLLNAIQLELKGEYENALAAVEELIAKCPPHSYKKNHLMDMTLPAIVEAIKEKMRDKGIPHLSNETNKSNSIKLVI